MFDLESSLEKFCCTNATNRPCLPQNVNVTNRSVIRSCCSFVEILSKVNRSNYLSLFVVYHAVFFGGGLAGLGDSHVNATGMLDG